MQDTQQRRDEALETFRNKQRSRAHMSLNQLRRVISSEHAQLSRQIPRGRESGGNEPFGEAAAGSTWRFRDEIAALRVYYHGAERLFGGRSQMGTALDRLADFRSSRKSGPRFVDPIRVRDTRRRGYAYTLPRTLEDYLEVSVRLQEVDEDQIVLLLAYYVAGHEAKELAKRLKVGVDALGGRLSQARRALRRALRGLIPPRPYEMRAAGREATYQAAGSDPVDERRAKAIRLVRQRAQDQGFPPASPENRGIRYTEGGEEQ